jgi:hypothetical protein
MIMLRRRTNRSAWMVQRLAGERLMKAAAAAHFSGRRYCVVVDYDVPGTDNVVVDVAAVMPRLRELKPRLRRGFPPAGILAHMIGADWMTVEEIEQATGYDRTLIGNVFSDALRQNWIEVDAGGPEPRARIADYRVPAKECVLAFSGAQDTAKKLDIWKSLSGRVNAGYFIFPYDVDVPSLQAITDTGAGVMRYHEEHGIFQEVVPADFVDIEDERGFALMTERILYDDFWVRVGESI